MSLPCNRRSSRRSPTWWSSSVVTQDSSRRHYCSSADVPCLGDRPLNLIQGYKLPKFPGSSWTLRKHKFVRRGVTRKRPSREAAAELWYVLTQFKWGSDTDLSISTLLSQGGVKRGKNTVIHTKSLAQTPPLVSLWICKFKPLKALDPRFNTDT